MKINELVEAMISPQPPGQPSGDNPTEPSEGPPNTTNTPLTPQPTGSTSQAGQNQPAGDQTNPNTPQVGQPMGAAAPDNTQRQPGTPYSSNQQQQQPVQQKDIDDIKNKITTLQGLLAKQQQPGSQPATQQQQPNITRY